MLKEFFGVFLGLRSKEAQADIAVLARRAIRQVDELAPSLALSSMPTTCFVAPHANDNAQDQVRMASLC